MNLTKAMREALGEPTLGFKLHIGASDFVRGFYGPMRKQTADALVKRGLAKWTFKWFNRNGDKVYDLEITDAGRKALEGGE